MGKLTEKYINFLEGKGSEIIDNIFYGMMDCLAFVFCHSIEIIIGLLVLAGILYFV